MKTRFAIIGAGVIGAVHARLIDSLADDAELVAVIDVEEERAAALAEQYGATAWPSADAAFGSVAIDAVAICLPSAMHADAAVHALESGKDVLIEKPIDISLAAADRVRAAESASGRIAGVVSQRRFQPPASFLKGAIERGLLGRVTSGLVESALFRPQSYYESGDWRGTAAIDGGGALMNQGIHALDLLVWMMGTPVRVSAETACVAHDGIEVEDVVGATITFASGAIGVLLASTAAWPGRAVRLSVHGDRGSAVMDADELVSFESDVVDPAEVGYPLVAEVPRSGWTKVDEAHRAQYVDFIEASRSRRRPLVTTDAGRRSLAVVLAVYKSARSGRPVELKES